MQSPGWSTFDLGPIQLALHILSDTMDEQPIPHAGLNLLVDSVDDARARIESAGGTVLAIREPNQFVKLRIATCADTDNNHFELRQHATSDHS